MIVILEIDFDARTYNRAPIKGWIVAMDTHDARRTAHALGLMQLASELYQWEFPPPGQHQLSTGHIMLVT